MPRETSIEAKYGFVTYKNYLLGLSYIIDLNFPDYSDIVNKLKTVQVRNGIDFEKIRSLLMNAWNSELLLNFPELLRSDFLKFSNHWSPVQSYYAIYLAIRALISAKNINAPGDHATTLIVLNNLICQEKLFPLPWGVLCNRLEFRNLPPSCSPRQINPLENPYHFKNDQNKLLDSFCLFLRTTFNRIINEKCLDWKESHPTTRGPRKRLPRGQREQIISNSRPISIFDCFYRLRIRSNYKDVDIFILGSTQPETKYYFDALCSITDKTLFLIENYICRYLGRNRMDQIITDYKNSDDIGITKRLQFGPQKRYEYYT